MRPAPLSLVTNRFPAIILPQLIQTPLTTFDIRAFILIRAIGLTAFAVATSAEKPRWAIPFAEHAILAPPL